MTNNNGVAFATAPPAGQYYGWADMMAKGYIKSEQAFQCPSDDEDASPAWNNPSTYTDYAINSTLAIGAKARGATASAVTTPGPWGRVPSPAAPRRAIPRRRLHR